MFPRASNFANDALHRIAGVRWLAYRRSMAGERQQDQNPFLSTLAAPDRPEARIGQSGLCRIGRSATNDLVLAEAAASREHAIVRREGGGCTLIDAGSRNGTLLNGRPVTAPTRLDDGDTITIGETRLLFRDPAQARPAAAQVPPVTAEATMFIPMQSLITVLVVDVRGFTRLSRAIGEDRLSTVMTTIFREAGALLVSAGCWSEKFIGDAIMAVWRNERGWIEAAELRRVLDTVQALERLFATMQAAFDLPGPLTFGAAVNTGPASIGNMGSGSTADFTALGDTVNKTFRLETASKTPWGPIWWSARRRSPRWYRGFPPKRCRPPPKRR